MQLRHSDSCFGWVRANISALPPLCLLQPNFIFTHPLYSDMSTKQSTKQIQHTGRHFLSGMYVTRLQYATTVPEMCVTVFLHNAIYVALLNLSD